MAVFINPFTDFGFKRIFGQDDSKDILIGFLNALFAGEMKIVDLRYRDKERIGDVYTDRSMIYDIFCIGDDGKEFIVEMQNKSQVNFDDRSLYYASGAIVGQSQKGSDWQYRLCPVIGIYLMNFSTSALPNRFRSDFVLREIRTGEQLSDRLRLIFLQMKKFNKTESQCTDDLDKWTFIMNHMETLDNIPWKGQNELFEKLEEMSKIAAMTEQERNQYNAYLRQYRDNMVVREAAIHEGLKKGLEQGRKEGLEQGQKEEKEKIARAMLSVGTDENFVSEMTGLTLDKLKSLGGIDDII